ncbi:unnamed protein product [Cunninghamella blakesleeana]
MTSNISPTWIQLWFLISSLVVYWDASYCLLRPLSMENGSLNYLFRPYNLYAKVDYVYGIPALEANDGFTSAQAFLNVIESTMNLFYLYLLRQQKYDINKVHLIGFLSASLTLYKTVLYWLNEYYSGFKHIGHNDLNSILILWIIPNGLWLLVPSLITFTLGKQIWNNLGSEKNTKKIN